MKTLLVPVLGVGGDAPALELANRIAATCDGHIDALHVQIDTLEELGRLTMGEGVMSQEIYDMLAAENVGQTAAAKKTFDRFCTAKEIAQVWDPGDCGVTARWHDCVGHLKDEIVTRGRRHDLVVIGRDASPFGMRVPDLADIVLRCGRPLLLAPARLPQTTGRRIAIAWRNTAESAHALTAAMTFIASAEKVVILTVSEDDADASEIEAGLLADQLRRTASVEVQNAANCTGHVADTLIDRAQAVQADMLVMGAYGHSRAREFILGGATRDMLRDCPFPLFIVH